MELIEILQSNSPREKSGSTASSRFDFQKDFSICKMLETHLVNKDYLFLFDYEEDLVIIDSEIAPNKISFFQIKGKKSGNWSLKALLQRDKSAEGKELLSILGKLYGCKIKFKDTTESLNFVSNQRFSLKLKDNTNAITKNNICFIELTDTDNDKIRDQIKEEHNLNDEILFNDITFYKVTDLSLEDSETHTIGKLTKFLEKLFPVATFKAEAIYKNIFNEVKGKSNFNGECKSFEDLIEKKGISKRNLTDWLKNLNLDKDLKEIWKEINDDLVQEGVKQYDRRRLKDSWRDLEIMLKDPNNDLIFKFIDQIESQITSLKQHNFDGNKEIQAILGYVIKNLTIDKRFKSYLSSELIKSIILLKLYE